jgi:hypothetical protein
LQAAQNGVFYFLFMATVAPVERRKLHLLRSLIESLFAHRCAYRGCLKRIPAHLKYCSDECRERDYQDQIYSM